MSDKLFDLVGDAEVFQFSIEGEDDVLVAVYNDHSGRWHLYSSVFDSLEDVAAVFYDIDLDTVRKLVPLDK